MSRWAATSTTCWRGPSGVSSIPSEWKSSTALLSGIGTWSCRLEAHGRVELLAIGDRWQLERTQHRALVGDAEAHALAQAAVLEQLAQRLGEHALVEHLALAHDVRRQRRAGRVLDDDRAIHARLHGGDVAGLDVQADDVGAGAAAEVDVEVEGGSLHADVTHGESRRFR